MDFNTLNDAGNTSPTGIWSDGTTMWVADFADAKIYAYSMSNRSRDSAKDFDTLTNIGNNSPLGIWSDGSTMWVADSNIYAYDLETKVRKTNEEFTNLDAGDSGPTGIWAIWSDETTMWIVDHTDGRLYAYKLSDKSRDRAKEFDTAMDISPTGIWSDGTIIWVGNPNNQEILAYKK